MIEPIKAKNFAYHSAIFISRERNTYSVDGVARHPFAHKILDTDPIIIRWFYSTRSVSRYRGKAYTQTHKKY